MVSDSEEEPGDCEDRQALLIFEECEHLVFDLPGAIYRLSPDRSAAGSKRRVVSSTMLGGGLI